MSGILVNYYFRGEQKACYNHRPVNTPSAFCLEYGDRNSLLDYLGYDTYQIYLSTDLWASIRSRQLSMNPNCFACSEMATQVHHGKYTRENLTGNSTEYLYSVCRRCHVASEFDGEIKLAPSEATQKLKEMRLSRCRLPVKKHQRTRKRTKKQKRIDRLYKLSSKKPTSYNIYNPDPVDLDLQLQQRLERER